MSGSTETSTSVHLPIYSADASASVQVESVCRKVYLSYAVELRNDNAKPTTKPSTMSRTLSIPTIEASEVYVSPCRMIFTVDTLTIVTKSRNTSNSRRPSCHPQKRQDHFGHDTAMHTHEDRPFGVLIHVTGAMLSDSTELALHSARSILRSRRTKYRSNSLESCRFR